MIVFPRLLSDLLDQIAPSRAAHLALDFTQHVLDLERAETEEPVLDACLGFVAAAHEAIDLGETRTRYTRARERLSEVGMRWKGHRYDVAKGAELVLRAARVGTERLEDRAAGRGPSTPLHCRDVARELQAEAGRWYAKRAPADADERLVARGARWEEARWQVQHVIATQPGHVLPGGDNGVSGSGGGN
ncbi:hypothetical protein [Streptomyces sp. NPDC088935]|uniref:hypothetical protein n=1 Tax=Streptomyces sp. NPDC088935 TaxID=3365916 RepID=UPI00382AE06C